MYNDTIIYKFTYNNKEAIIHIDIDFRSGIPITNQIVEQIYDQYIQGEYQSGQQLPTVRELARQLKVNFNTVARAYRMLDQAGIITTQHGRGTYILPQTNIEISQRMMDLDQLTKDFLQRMEEKSYSPTEILAVFQRNIRQMKTSDDEQIGVDSV